MAALVEGHQYGLSSENSTSCQKSIVHVKLTDSALKAIEEFQKLKDSTGRKTTIQFQGSNGVIKVPRARSSTNQEDQFTFLFSVSSIPVDPKGSFECIKQNASQESGEGELDMLGAMLHKVSIQATDDSYQKTRESMNQAVEDSKKQRAKEIKASGPGVGRRVKKVLRDSIPHIPPPSSHTGVQQPIPFSFKAAAPIRPQPREDLPRSSHSSQASRPTTLPNLQKSSGSSNYLTANRGSGVMNLPLRERIIHILAIRPYKKIELVCRLQKDGIKDRDRHGLGGVLNQVGNFNPRENSYSLARHLYTEVRNDWAYYTETDRQQLKRKMNHLPETGLSTTSPAISPCHSTGSQGSPNSSQKRLICEEKTPSDQPPKKQRVANVSNYHDTAETKVHIAGSHSNKPIKSSPVSPESPGTGNQENNMLDDIKPDYTRKYRKIGSGDQRQLYKTDFNEEYEEYRKLHSHIEGVTTKFVELKDQLDKQPKDTPDYKNIRKRIMCEYRLVKDDSKYVEQRQRHGYLHHKLGHIKKLISDFDHARLAAS